MKRIFAIDWGLIPSSILCAATGIGLHVARLEGDHAAWHVWSAAHIATSLLFTILMAMHVHTHWGWYKGWMARGLGRKSRVTATVSVLSVIVVTTGIALLGVEGANSDIGLWHYRLGLATIALWGWHVAKRWRVLKGKRKG